MVPPLPPSLVEPLVQVLSEGPLTTDLSQVQEGEGERERGREGERDHLFVVSDLQWCTVACGGGLST